MAKRGASSNGASKRATPKQAREAKALRERGAQTLLERWAEADDDVSILGRAPSWVEERRVVAGVLCQLQWVQCGKRRFHVGGVATRGAFGCWCMLKTDPPFHGPYWYAYTMSKRRKLRSHYVGKVISVARVRAAVA